MQRLEGLGLAVREGWEVEKGLAEREPGAATMRGLRNIVSWIMRGTYILPASNESSKLWRMGEEDLVWGR